MTGMFLYCQRYQSMKNKVKSTTPEASPLVIYYELNRAHDSDFPGSNNSVYSPATIKNVTIYFWVHFISAFM